MNRDFGITYLITNHYSLNGCNIKGTCGYRRCREKNPQTDICEIYF